MSGRRALVATAVVLLAACGGKERSSATEIRVAAASDLALAFEEVTRDFKAKTGINVIVTAGSTGLLAKQIEEGAQFDLFAAANISFVDKVIAAGECDPASKQLYARGRIVLWSATALPERLEDLADPKWGTVAIANPDHAPYGKAAREALEKVGVWDGLERDKRLVRGENILQTMQYAKRRDAEVAVVALSLATVETGGHTLSIDPGLHAPLDQALVVCSEGEAGGAAARFAEFLASPDGREIMTRYGFLLPGETLPPPTAGRGGGS